MTVIWIGRHRKCGRVVRFETPATDGMADMGFRTVYGVPLGHVSLWMGKTMLDCECGSPLIVKAVRGHAVDIPCGPTCHRATGAECKCACAGANHGSAYAEM